MRSITMWIAAVTIARHRDDEKFPHVVLLLPGGQGLEAVGSYDGSRARGLRGLQLTPSEKIQKALKKKMEQKNE